MRCTQSLRKGEWELRCGSTATANAYASRPSFARRATFAIRVPSTTKATSPTTGSSFSAQPKARRWKLLPGFAGSRVAQWHDRIHHSIIGKIHKLWSPEDAALIDASVIGESAFLSPATRVDFQRSGTYHILVVSGVNVSILAFVVFWVMRHLRLSEALASGTTVLLCAAYAFVTDVGPPVWRAVLMLTIYLGVRLLYRERSMLNALGAAALGLMVADPHSVRGPSFQLTFLAVLIIAAIAIPLLQRTSQLYLRGLRHLDSQAFDRILAPRVAQMRLDLRLVAGRLTYLLGARVPRIVLNVTARATLSDYELLCFSSLMQVGLALPMAYYFHRATVVGIPANALSVPLTELLMPSAVLSVGLNYVAGTLAKLPAMAAAVALHGITGTVRWLGVAHCRPSRGHAGTRHHCYCSLHPRHRDGAGSTGSKTSDRRSRAARLWRSLV
jgi:ComEC/Rec2-related protein